jgi:hypothetical protein
VLTRAGPNSRKAREKGRAWEGNSCVNTRVRLLRPPSLATPVVLCTRASCMRRIKGRRGSRTPPTTTGQITVCILAQSDRDKDAFEHGVLAADGGSWSQSQPAAAKGIAKGSQGKLAPLALDPMTGIGAGVGMAGTRKGTSLLLPPAVKSSARRFLWARASWGLATRCSKARHECCKAERPATPF